MYAVVSTGGKQLKVEQGVEAVVEKLDAAVGDRVTLDVLFVSDGSDMRVGDSASSATVTAEVVEHFLGEKVTVFKFKKRKGYKRLTGHRQPQTRIRVTEIEMGAAPAKTAKKPVAKAEKPKPAAEEKAEAPKAEAPKAEAPKAEAPKAEAAPAAQAEPAQCEAIKANGERCGNKAKEGSKYCGVHAKKYEG